MRIRQYHIGCCQGDVARYVLLLDHPARISIISTLWTSFREVAIHREYGTNMGLYKGVPISAISTGIGNPSTGIAVGDLARIGADTMIKVGSCGAIQPNINYPAVAGYEVLR